MAKGQVTPVVSRRFEHHTGDRMISLVSTPILRENTLGVAKGLPPLIPLPPTSREDLQLDGYLKHPPCREGTVLLQTSMPPPGFEPRPNGTDVSDANHYTG
ncbi:hypothetical protein TNCV_4245651 [Trichonephila clavipes]|nr:hypothetical protein TNCV_4245651 [Trichonephila clavipes]